MIYNLDNYKISKILISLHLFFNIILFSHSISNVSCNENIEQNKREDFDPYLSSTMVEEKLKYLFYLKNILPDLFNHASIHHVNILEILEKQIEVYGKVKDHATYLKFKESGQSSNLLSLKIKEVVRKETNSKILDPKFLKIFKEQLKSVISKDKNDSINTTISMENYLLQKIEEKAKKLSFNPNTILSLIAKDLFKSQFDHFLKMDFEGKLESLKRIIDSLKVPLKETLLNVRLSDLGISNDDLLEKLREQQKIFEDLSKLVSIYILLDKNKASDSSKMGDLINRSIDELSESSFDLIKDKHHFKTSLSDLINKLPSSHLFKKALHTYGVKNKVIDDYMDLVKHEREIVEQSGEELQFKEVPPFIGIFRGFAGNDCSTKLSSCYANSPYERVFFISNKSGELKGYFAGTILETKESGRVFYLHTIAGGRISGKDTELILEGIHHFLLKELGVTKLTLPPKEKLESLINTSQIRSKLVSLVAGKKGEQNHYFDESLRSDILDTNSKENYDKVENNSSSIAFQSSRPLTDFKVAAMEEESKQMFPPFNPKEGISELEKLLFAYDLYSIGQNHSSGQVIKLLKNKITIDDIGELRNKIKNSARMTTDLYKERLNNYFKRIGSNFNSAFQIRPELFEIGLLSSSDSLSEKFQKGSLVKINKLLKEKQISTLELIFEDKICKSRESSSSENSSSESSSDEEENSKIGNNCSQRRAELENLNQQPDFRRSFLQMCESVDLRNDFFSEEEAFSEVNKIFSRNFNFIDQNLLQTCKLSLLPKLEEVLVQSSDREIIDGFIKDIMGNPFLTDQTSWLDIILKKGDYDKQIATYIFPNSFWQNKETYIDEMIDRNKAGKELIINTFTKEKWATNTAPLEKLLLNGKGYGAFDRDIVKSLFSREEWILNPTFVEKVIDRGFADDLIISEVLSKESWKKYPHLVEKLIKKGSKLDSLIKNVISKSYWIDSAKWIEQLLEQKIYDHQIVEEILSKADWKEHSKWVDLILNRQSFDGPTFINSVLTKKFTLDNPSWVEKFILLTEGNTLSDIHLIQHLFKIPEWRSYFKKLTKIDQNEDDDIFLLIMVRNFYKKNREKIDSYRTELKELDLTDAKKISELILRGQSEPTFRACLSPHLVDELFDSNKLVLIIPKLVTYMKRIK